MLSINDIVRATADVFLDNGNVIPAHTLGVITAINSPKIAGGISVVIDFKGYGLMTTVISPHSNIRYTGKNTIRNRNG